MNSMRIITHYELLSDLTEQMREAAARGEWDRLVSIEQQRDRQLAVVKVADATATFDEPSRQRKMQLIKKVLADDDKIRHHTEAWIGQLQCFMQSNRQEQRLQQAYSN